MERIEKNRKGNKEKSNVPKANRERGRAGKSRTEKGNIPQSREESRPGGKKRQLPCPVANRCGSCQYLHLTYDQQLKIKKDKLTLLLKDICPLKGMLGMENPYHYRNKVHAVFGCDRKGRPVSGIYEAGTHHIVPAKSCLIEDEKSGEIIETIRSLTPSFKIRYYDEDTGYGLLRHVLIKRGFATGQIMVVLVTASPVFPSKNNFVRALRQRHPEITTVIQNINGRGTSMVLGEKEQILYGPGYIEDVLCGYTFRISSKSFYQINPVQTEILYQKALDLAALTGKETVIDAYCGIGTIGIIASGKAGEIIGVERNPDAVRDAIQNAKRNGVKNIRFYCNDAGKFMSQMAAAGEKAQVVIMDPPRSGSTKEFMDAIAVLEPEKVVYISCGPETLARDLKYLRTLGYEAKEAWGCDLFGWTEHVETCVLLSRKKSSGKSTKIEIEIDLNEADKRECIGTATYQEIKDYIWEHYQTKVSHLYIAQIKKKCGLDVGENFNKPKTEGNKVPNCPEEKERMIREALEYFGMINKE